MLFKKAGFGNIGFNAHFLKTLQFEVKIKLFDKFYGGLSFFVVFLKLTRVISAAYGVLATPSNFFSFYFDLTAKKTSGSSPKVGALDNLTNKAIATGLTGATPSISNMKELVKALQAADWRNSVVRFDIPSNPQSFGELVRKSKIEAIMYESKYTQEKCLAIFPENLGPTSCVELSDIHPAGVTTRLDSVSYPNLIYLRQVKINYALVEICRNGYSGPSNINNLERFYYPIQIFLFLKDASFDSVSRKNFKFKVKIC